MKIKIISVGKLKEKYLVSGVNEYVKRLGAYTKVEMYEVMDESIPYNCSMLNEQQIKQKEGNRILSKVKAEDYVVLLDLAGESLDSIQLSKHIEKCMVDGKSSIAFVIGGSLGHGRTIIERSNFRLCFSNMTFPHQLMRLLVVEQVYRAFKIIRNESYHK